MKSDENKDKEPNYKTIKFQRPKLFFSYNYSVNYCVEVGEYCLCA